MITVVKKERIQNLENAVNELLETNSSLTTSVQKSHNVMILHTLLVILIIIIAIKILSKTA